MLKEEMRYVSGRERWTLYGLLFVGLRPASLPPFQRAFEQDDATYAWHVRYGTVSSLLRVSIRPVSTPGDPPLHLRYRARSFGCLMTHSSVIRLRHARVTHVPGNRARRNVPASRTFAYDELHLPDKWPALAACVIELNISNLSAECLLVDWV